MYHILFVFLPFLFVTNSKKCFYQSETKIDSSGIYLNQAQFNDNLIQYKSDTRIMEKAGIFWSDFDFEASGIIKTKDSNGNIIQFNPGEIYGFWIDGVKFLYIDKEKKYRALLYRDSVISFFAKENEIVGFKYIDKYGSILFSVKGSENLYKFDTKNLKNNFSDDTLLLGKLQRLLIVLKKKDYYVWHRKYDFLQCQKIIEDYTK